MNLRRRMAVLYALIVLTCLLLLGLAHHEFIREPRWRKQAGIPEPIHHEMIESIEVFFYSMIPIVLSICGWLIHRTLGPINSLTHGIEQIHAHNLREPLPRTGKDDDVDHLIDVFNNMKSRVDESFQQVREFTLHASHELKTPLTVMRAELETALASSTPWTTEQRDRLHSLHDEVQRLTRLVNDLTLLTKADAGLVALDAQPVDLGELLRECFEDTQALAEPHGVQVSLGQCAATVITGDRHRLRQLLLNLADNAARYNRPGGMVTLALRQAEGFAIIEIANTGAGIPPKLRERIFERFVRGDEARRKAVDGCGLGLAICQWIVQAHHGHIGVVSVPDATTTVTVHLPLHYSSAS